MGAVIYSKAGSASATIGATLRTNVCTNPGLGVDSTGWGNQVFFGTGGAGTLGRFGVIPPPGCNAAFVYRMTWTTAPSSNNVYLSFGSATADVLPVVAGTTITASMFGLVTWAGANMGMLMAFYTSAGALVSTTSVEGLSAAPTNNWARRSMTAVVPATASRLVVRLYSQNVIPNVGGLLQGTGLLVEVSSSVGGYFDGATTDVLYPPGPTARDYAWTGTAHASTSLERALVYPDVYEALPVIDPLVTSRSRSRNRIQWVLNRADPNVVYAEAGLRTGQIELFFGHDEAAAAEAEQMFREGTTFRLVYPDRLEWEMVFVVDEGGQIERELDDTTRNHWMLRVDYQEIDGADY